MPTTAFVMPSSHSLVPTVVTQSRISLETSYSTVSLSVHKTNESKLRAGTTTSSSSSSALSPDQKSVLSVGIWCLLDIAFRRVFQKLNLATKFPSSLGGCGVVLAVLLLTKSMSSSDQESKLHRILTPGAALLAKWLPVFFVPSLVTLPLIGGIDSLGGPAEVRSTQLFIPLLLAPPSSFFPV